MNYKFTLLLGVLLLATLTSLSVDTPPTMNGNNSFPKYIAETNVPVALFPSFTITDEEGDVIKGLTISFSAGHHNDQDVLSYTNDGWGITGIFDKNTGVLKLSGDASPANYQAAVRSIKYINDGSAGSISEDRRTMTISLVNADYLESTGHFYEYVSASLYWASARTAASARSYYGLQGYLATITSEEENNFLLSKTTNGAWFAGSDFLDEGVWIWREGPEDGEQFSDADGNSVGGSYVNWDTGEPDNVGGDQDHIAMFSQNAPSGSQGKWIDRNATSNTYSYLVEYGGMDGDQTINMNTTTTLDIIKPQPPVIDGHNALATYSKETDTPMVLFPEFTITDTEESDIKGLTISFTAGHHNDQDNLLFINQNGITGSFDKSTGVLTLSGNASPAEYQAAVRSITYKNDAPGAASYDQRTMTISLVNADYLESTGHFYEYVNTAVKWNEANTVATGVSYYGLQGYLVTISSAEENSFILDKISAVSWLGASDADTETTWEWVTGPENGTHFSTGSTPNGDNYTNWRATQPNNQDGQDYMTIDDKSSSYPAGEWNDRPVDDNHTFIIEYGGMEGDPALTMTTSTTLNIVEVQPPELNGNDVSPTYNTGYNDPVVVFPNFTISGPANNSIRGITIGFTAGNHSDQDNLSFTDQNGITGNFDKSNGILVLSGDASPATYQAAVRSITYTNNAEFSSVNNEQRTLTISLANTDYLDFNGHFYEHVTGSYSWAAAKTAAAAKTYYGLQGYLCTVTSEEENSHILKIEDDPNGTLWLGASDNDTPNTWKWLSGPENGSIFYQDGSVYDQSSYENWATGQPSGNEHYLQIFTDNVQPEYTPGEWNDRSGGYESGYIVEYGGMTGDPALTMTTTTTLNIDLVTPKSPGGIVDNLALWLDAEKGFTYTSATDAEWIDQSHNRLALNVNLIQNPSNATAAPTLAENSNNFNPTLAFNGTSTGLASAVDAADFGFSEVTVFSVQQVASGAHSHCVWHYDDKGFNDLAVFIDGDPTNQFNITVNRNSLGNIADPVLNDDTPHLLGFASNNSSAEIYVDAFKVQTSGGQTQLPGPGAMMIGLDADNAEAQDGGNLLNGNVGEVIMFNKKLSAPDQQKVGSYLALKYGISLSSNYIASDGTTSMWADDSDGYDQNIFGIGRDDASGLNQKVSKSVSAGTVLTVALDADFISANNDTERATEHANDMQFLTIADNGAALTPQTLEVDMQLGFNLRLAREWKVDATNFTQSVNMKFEGYNDEWTLFKDEDGDFSSGAIAIGTLDENGEITNILLADGDYLTLGKQLPAPGGIAANLRVWFDANSGTTNGGSAITNGSIKSWEGRKPYDVGSTIVNNVAGDPAVVPNSANFNSVVSFDGNDAIRTSSTAPYTTYFNSSSDNNTVFLVKKTMAGNVEAGYGYESGGIRYRAGYFERADGYQRVDYGVSGTILAGSTTTIDKYVIARQDVQQPGDLSIYLDGALERQTSSFNSLAGSIDGYLGFGANPYNFTSASTTDIAEYIIYASDLSAFEVKAVESYLALKYGISLNQTVATDYLASDGTVIWSASDNVGYITDIFGIGQDDGSGLNQKISRSVNNNNSPVLSTIANFSLSNADASRTALGDGNFMVMAHNNSTENSFNSSFNGGTNNRTDRVWKVDETGTVEDVYLAIPYAAVTFPSGGTPSLIISNDENFDDQDQVVTLTYNRDQGGYYAKINPADGDYISLAISEVSVTLPTFYRTESTDGATTGITSYPSYTDFINNTNATYTAFSQHWNYDDSFFADGIYFYRTNNAKTTVTRYPSLADLGENTKGIVYDFTSGGNPQDWNDDDEFFASGDQFFRTASSNSISKTTGLTAYNSFADLVSNTNGTYTPFNHDYNYEDQFFHDGEYFLRTNTSTTNQEQFGVARYQSLDDLSNHTPYDTKGFGPWSTNDDIFAVGITASFTISEDTLAFDENGGKGEFYVVLDAQPATNVVLDITSDDTNEATVNKAALTFTSANWNIPQTIRVTGVDDNTVKVDTATITISVNESSDATFAALANQSVEIILEDDDVAGFTLSESTLTIDEDAETDSFTVVLNTQPISDVVFDVLSDDDNEAIVDNGTLTFTSGDWNTPQTVTVTGVNDEIDREDNATITISVNAASSDDTYDAEEDQTVAVALTDDDEVPTVSTTAASSVISTSVVLGGNITDNGTSEVTETGVVYSSINTSPEIGGDNVTKDVNGAETGEFSETIGSLAPNTTYYYQAYAVSNAGISYGGVQSFTTKQTQVITFNELADKTYGDIDFDPAATASSNLTITYSSSDAAVATIVEGKIHIVGAGSCIIYADQEGNEVYDSAPQVSQALIVGKATLTVTADDKTKTYGQANPELTVSYSGFVDADSKTDIATEPTASTLATTASGVGTYGITASGGSDDNYAFSYSEGTLSVTKATLSVTADNKLKTYGAGNPPLTVSYSGFVNDDSETDIATEPTAWTLATTASGVGTYTITASGGSDDNYAFSYSEGTLSVTKATLSVTADDKSKVYGTANPELTFTYDGFVNDDNQSSLTTAPIASTSATIASAAGTYPVTVSGGADENYTFSYTPGTLTIDKATLTVTAEDKSRVYGAANPVLTFTYDGFVNEDSESDLATAPVASTTAGISSAVGTYPVSVSGGADENYTFSYTSGTLTINKATLTVTADNKSKVYDGSVFSPFTVSYSGFVAEETESDLGGSLSFSGNAVYETHAGTDYVITPGGLTSSNYDISFVNGKLDITKAPLTVTAEDKSKVYDGTVYDQFTLSYSGFVAEETKSVLGGHISFSGNATTATDVGIGYEITPGGLTSLNYNISFVSGKLDITKAPLTVTADNKSKVYDGSVFSPFTVSYSGFVAEETKSDLVGTLTFSGTATMATDAGTDYVITPGGLTSSNYDISFVSGKLDITKATLTVTADYKSKEYDGSVFSPFTVSYSGFIAGEGETDLGGTLTYSGTATTATDVGTDYVITPEGLTSSNYDISFVSGKLDITKATLTVTADYKSKEYDGSVFSLFTVSYSGFVAEENDTDLDGSLSFSGNAITATDAGEYVIIPQGLTSSNYYISFVNGTLDITPKAITVTADANQMIEYGDPDPTFTYSTSPALLSGDFFTGYLNRLPGKNVGYYAIYQGSLSAGPNYALTFVSNDFEIRHREMFIEVDREQQKVYGDNDPTFTYFEPQLYFPDDSFTGSLSREEGEDVGSYEITMGSLSAGSNYVLKLRYRRDFVITPKPITVTADAHQTKVYGDSDPTFTYSTSIALESGDYFTGSLSRVAGENVGSYAIEQGTLSAGTNYAISFESDAFVITKAILTVTANDKSKVYGTANPELTFNYSGFVNGDTESVLATVPVVTTTATTESPAGNYKIKVSGGDDENYTFSYTDAILTVERATLTVSVSADNKVYDGTTTASVLLSDNRVSGDLLTVNTTSAEFEDKNVGEEKTVTVSGIILSGDDANNYELASTTASATADITRKNLTVSNAVAQNKVYDGTTDAVISGAVLKGVVLNDDVQLENGTIGTFERATSGSDIEVTTLMTLNGEDAPNYLLVQPTGLVADILEKALTINGTFTVTDKKYDGTTDATIVTNKLELSGIQGEDEVALSNVVVAFETASAGNGLPVKIISADLTGDDADQYSLSFENSPTTTASILSKEVTLAGAGGISKIYDGNTLLPSGMVAYGALNGVLSEDETQVELTGNPLYDLAEAGDRVIVQGDLKLTGPKADNYTLVWTDGEGIIGEATLTVVANNDAKFVTQDDDSNYAGVSISGYVNGESNSVIDQSGLTITRSNVTENSAGEYTDVLEASGLMADNYVFTYLSGDYSIIPAHELLVEINDSNIIYSNVPGYTIDNAKYLDSEGNTIKDLTENITALGNNQFRVDDGVGNAVNFTISEINPEYNSLNTRLAVGSYQLKATDVTGSSTNFNNNIHVTGALTVNTKEVEVQLISGSEQKAFDGDANMDNLDWFTSGLVTGDDVELSGSGSFNQSEAGSDISYSVEVALQGVDKDNYHLKTDVPVTGNDGRIIEIELTVIDAKASNKVYDGTTSATVSGATLNGAIAGDDVTLANKNTGVFVTDAVGNDIEVMTSMTLAGEDKDNYVLIQPTGLTANITPKELTVTNATAENKVYDGSTDVTVVGATLSGVIADDEVLLENAESGTFKQDIVGTEIEVTTAMTISGADAPNYVLNQPFGITADITTRELTVKDAVAENKIYDGTVSAVISGAVLDGNVAGDDVSLTNDIAGIFAQSSVGDNIQVVTQMALEGDDKDNYTLKQPSYLTANITAAELTLSGSFVAENKEYDGTAIATMIENNLQFDGLAPGDIISLDSIILAFETSNAGIGLEVDIIGAKIAGSDASKYMFSLDGSPVTTANINKKELIIIADDKAKDYDGLGYSPFTVSYNGFIDGEDETVLSGTLSFTGTATTAQDAGTGYVVTPGGLSSENYEITYVDGYLDIHKTDQTITFDPIPQQILSNSSFELSAVASSGLTIEYSSSDESVATVSGKMVTFVNSGTCTIYANQTGNVNYNAAEQVSQTLTIISYVSGDSNHDGQITPPEIAGDSNEDGQIDDGEIAGDTNGDGTITAPEVAGDTDGNGQIDEGEVTGDTNGDGTITAPEVAGDTDGNGQIDDGEIAGDTNGDGTITEPEVAGDNNGDGIITAPEVAGDTDGNGEINDDEVAGDTDGNGQIEEGEVTGDTNGDGTITAPEVAGDTDGNGQIDDGEIAGDTNGDGTITEPEVAGDTNGDGTITSPEVAGDTDGNGQIDDGEIAGDTDGNGQIDDSEVAGDTDGNGEINDDEVAGDTDGNGQIEEGEVIGDTNGDGTITAPEVAGDADGNGQIDDGEIAGDSNHDGQITPPEIAGDSNEDGQINDGEIAGDTNGDGTITAPEVAGDTDGNGQIDDGEIAGDTNGDGTITAPEIAGDTDGNGQIDDSEVAGDTNGDGTITAPEVAGDTDGNGQIDDGEIAGDTNGDGTITAPEIAGDTDGNGQIDEGEVTGDTNGDGIITAPEIAGDTDGNGQIDDGEIAGDTNGDGIITAPEIAGDTDGNGEINDDEVAGDTDGNGQIDDGEIAGDTNGDGITTAPEIAGDTDGNGEINDDEVAGDTNGDGSITSPEVAGDTDGNGQIDDGEIAGDTDGNGQIDEGEVPGDTNGDGTITAPEVAGDTDGNGQIDDGEIAGDTNGDGTITAPEVAGDTDGNGQIDDGEVAGDTDGNGEIDDDEVAGDTDGNGQIDEGEVTGDTNGDGTITAPEVAGDADGNGQIDDGEIAGDSNHDGQITPPEIAGDSNEDGQINDGEIAGDTNGDGSITAPEVAGDTDGNGQIDDGEIAGDTNGDGTITEPEVAGDTNGDGIITAPEIAGDTDGNGEINDDEVAGDTDGNGQIDEGEVTGDTNGDGIITAPEIAGDTDGNGQIDDGEIAGDTDGNGQIDDSEVAGDTDGNGEINDDEVAGDTDGNGQIEEGEVTGDTNGDGTITAPEVAGDADGNVRSMMVK
nr:MBG domain-containing protein [uncultured Draconibacterium sp.]